MKVDESVPEWRVSVKNLKKLTTIETGNTGLIALGQFGKHHGIMVADFILVKFKGLKHMNLNYVDTNEFHFM